MTAPLNQREQAIVDSVLQTFEGSELLGVIGADEARRKRDDVIYGTTTGYRDPQINNPTKRENGMPLVNFKAIQEKSFAQPPVGVYECRLDVSNIELDEHGQPTVRTVDGKKVPRIQETKSGDEWWRISATITAGEHKGLKIRDGLYFSEKGINRVKLVCKSLGVITGDEENFEVTPEMLDGKLARVRVDKQEPALDRNKQQKFDKKTGEKLYRAKVAFDGYEAMDEGVPF